MLWLIYIGRTLKEADTQISHIEIPTRRSSASLQMNPLPATLQVDLFSYSDDVNPLVVSTRTTKKEHRQLCHQVNQVLEAAANQHHLR